MLHGYEFVLHGGGLFLSGGKGGVHIGGDVEPVSLPAASDRGNLPQLRLRGGLQALHGDVHFPQQLPGQAVFLTEQGQQQVNLLHLLMVVGDGQVLGLLDSLH